MVLQQLNRAPGRFGAAALALGFAVSVCGPALAGPIGAIGDVYVSDGDQTGIYQYDGLTGGFVQNGSQGYFAGRSPRAPYGNAWGPDGNLYAADFGTYGRWSIDKFDGNTGALLATVVNYNNTSVTSVAKGLAFGPDGDLYVGDWWRARIDRYDGTTFAFKAGYQAVPGENLLGTPNGMTFAPNGNLMVVSGGFNKVLQFSTAANGVSLMGTFADLGLSQQPQDLTFGPNGNLFVTGGGQAFGGGGNVMEFNGTTGAYIQDFVPTLPGGGSTASLRFDNHGRLLVSIAGAIEGFNVQAYDAASGNPLGTFIADGSGGISYPYFISIKPVPEPATIGLLLVGGMVLGRRRGV
jgi:sugar lactone lactonase YvrE